MTILRRDYAASLSGSVRNVSCPFCASTLPALERLHERYRERGLVVLGVYHPKPPAAVDAADVAAFVRSSGVTFPVAIDERWELVRRWWLAYGGGGWTSVTWVVDGGGTIRAVHPGGELHDGGGPGHERCRADLERLVEVLETLLAEAG